MMARLLGLLSNERFANEMSAVTRVIVILHTQRHAETPRDKLHSSIRYHHTKMLCNKQNNKQQNCSHYRNLGCEVHVIWNFITY